MLEHNDEMQDLDMIKRVFQKVVSDMEQMESDRLMPDHMKPKMEVAKIDVTSPTSEHEMSESPEMESEEHELDPEILNQLMDKANSADDEGSTEEDHVDELDPELADAVRKKKAMK